MSSVPPNFVHDPNARVDYAIDWGTPSLTSSRSWLEPDEAITSSVWSISDPSMTVVPKDDGSASGSCSAWVSGTPSTNPVQITCHVTTSAGRQDDRSINLIIAQR